MMRFFKTTLLVTALAFLSNYQSYAHKAANPTDVFLGYWVGWFEPDKDVKTVYTGEQVAWTYQNKINISIDKIDGVSVTGHSVVAGNNRPFTGTVKKSSGLYEFSLKEPGDDKYDGVFKFLINETTMSLTGTWKANNKINIPSRHYTLEKKIFKYDPAIPLNRNNRFIDWMKKGKSNRADYDYSYFTTTQDLFRYNASVQLLTKEQVANLKKADLFILRNSIYARHGYSFKHQQLRAYFDREPWYIPVSTDVKSEFTATEKKNIELLMRYENNAKEYYDVFGRG